jgi:hypothetical protein
MDVEHEMLHVDNPIYLSRLAMDTVIRAKGGFGVSANAEAEVGFNELGYVTITRPEFERIVRAEGGLPFSDSHWKQLEFSYSIERTRVGLAPDPSWPGGSAIYLSDQDMHRIICSRRGQGLSAVLGGVEFDERGYTTITRTEFERIMHEQGGWSFSDPQWNHMTSIYRR